MSTLNDLSSTEERPVHGLAPSEDDKLRQGIVDWIEEHVGEELLLADGFETAFVGVGKQCSKPVVAVYDEDLCIKRLMDRDGMSLEEAVEFFDFNVAGAWVGPQTPLIMRTRRPEIE